MVVVGAGTALEVLRARKPFVMVINDSLMNNHQLELADTLLNANYATHCTPSQLAGEIAAVADKQFDPFPSFEPQLFAKHLDQFLFGEVIG